MVLEGRAWLPITIMQAVEHPGYRVTVRTSPQAGLNVNLAQQRLLTLAADAGGHLQVAESGEIVYLFPKTSGILRNKLALRLQEWWKKNLAGFVLSNPHFLWRLCCWLRWR